MSATARLALWAIGYAMQYIALSAALTLLAADAACVRLRRGR